MIRDSGTLAADSRLRSATAYGTPDRYDANHVGLSELIVDVKARRRQQHATMLASRLPLYKLPCFGALLISSSASHSSSSNSSRASGLFSRHHRAHASASFIARGASDVQRMARNPVHNRR